MQNKFDVVCIGDATLDITMCNIPKDALSVDSSYADTILISSGGDATNQAAVLSALGCSTALVAKVGNDAIGNLIYTKIQDDLISQGYLVRADDKSSGFCIVVVMPNGERSFLVWAGSGKKDLSLSEIDMRFLEETKAICVGSLFCLKELDNGGIKEIFSKAKTRGILTFADMTADAYGIGGTAFLDTYPYIDYLMPSLVEAQYVTGKDSPKDIASCLLESGVKNVVLKLGDKGCYFKNAIEEFYVNPYVIEAIDTTGCGDNFTAAFIYGVLNGYDMYNSVLFGCAAGAINTTRIGAHGAIISAEQVLKFQKQNKQLEIKREN